MLLTGLVSDKQGRLMGTLGDGKYITLSVPHPRAEVVFRGISDEHKKAMEEDLFDLARKDSGKYYFISATENNAHDGDGPVCFIPYLTFEK